MIGCSLFFCDVTRDVNTPDAVNRKTPLMIAIEHDKLDAVRELISKGADVKLTDAEGRNVLHYAVEFAHDENILKEVSAGMHALSAYKHTP